MLEYMPLGDLKKFLIVSAAIVIAFKILTVYCI